MNQNFTTKAINPSMLTSNIPITPLNSHKVSSHTWTNLSFANNRKPQITIGLPTNSSKSIASSLNFNIAESPMKTIETPSVTLQPIQSQVLQFIPKQTTPQCDTLDLNDTLSEEDFIGKEPDFLNRKTVKEEHFYEYGRWSQKEEELFLQGMMMYGNDWKYVQRCVKTRSPSQTRSHAQKFFMKLRRQLGKSREYEMIKKTVVKIFTKILGDKFKPGNLSEFVVRMKNLLLSYDTNPMRVLHEKKHKILISKNILDSNDEETSSVVSCKPDQIFLVLKDKRRIAARGLMKENIKGKKESSCINFVNINMVNNFNTHNYCEGKYGDLFGIHIEPIHNNNTKDNTNQVNIFEEQANNNDNISYLSFP